MLEKGLVWENEEDYWAKPYKLYMSKCLHLKNKEAVECLNEKFKEFYIDRDLEGVWTDEKSFAEYGGDCYDVCKWYAAHLAAIGGFEYAPEVLPIGHCVLLVTFNKNEYCLIDGYDLFCSSI